jgi:hypothetical protein
VGLDAQIRSANRQSMGTSDEVQAALASAFPGIRFISETYHQRQTLFEAVLNFLPGGINRAMSKPGTKGYYGDYKGNGFSADFRFAAGEVRQIDVELYGDTANANLGFARLQELKGWATKYD